MSKYRQAARVDDNQAEIVRQLRSIPGVTVEPGHSDLLIGRSGLTFWIELKNPNKVKKSGGFKKGSLKDSQVDLLDNWAGHYSVCWTIEQILQEIGVTK